MDEPVQLDRNSIHQQRPKRKNVDFWNWKQKRWFRWHSCCIPKSLRTINATPHRCYTQSRLPTIKVAPLHVTQPQCKLSCRRVYQGVLIEDRKVSWFVDETVQSGRNPIHQRRPKGKNVDFWNLNQKRWFRWHHCCIPTSLRTIKVTPHRGYTPSRLPTIKVAPHTGHPASVQTE